jgi:MFS family permease
LAPARSPGVVIFTIVLAQFCGTSLWFAGNAVVRTLQITYAWPDGSAGHLTTAVQTGFILGTLAVALTGISDRMSPSWLFFISCFAGAFSNALAVFDLSSFGLAMTSRTLTGFCLGGIYPIGMKIASDWRKEGLGNWLGALVGALVLGTALPHALRLVSVLDKPAWLLISVSLCALTGGALLFAVVPDGPYRRRGAGFSSRHLKTVFRVPEFRASAFGYFGHMWELYAFWAFVPWIIIQYNEYHNSALNVPFYSFLVIGAGAIGCWAGGRISIRTGSATVARTALFLSGLCCLFTPLLYDLSPALFLTFTLVWGLTVVADSPQFSALVAENASPEIRGTAITITVCIGFAITIVSIQLLNLAADIVPYRYLLLLLAPGPVFGLISGRKKSAFQNS